MTPQVNETVVIPRQVWLDKRKRTLARAIYGQFSGSESVANNDLLIEWVDELREMIAPVKTDDAPGLILEIKEAKMVTKSNAVLRYLISGEALIQDICDATGLSYSNVYATLQSSIKLGLVGKIEEIFDNNKRRHRYFLTQWGKSHAAK